MITHFNPFSIARLPRIEFGKGTFGRTAELAARFGSRVLIVTGARSFPASERWQQLLQQLAAMAISHEHITIDGEPSPAMVDAAVNEFATSNIDVVLGIGGGSAMDAAKAIAGLLRVKQSVMDFLEGVGAGKRYDGPKQAR